MRKRLFWQLFMGFFLVVLTTTLVVGTIGWIAYNPTDTEEAIRPIAAFAVESLGLEEASPEAMKKGFEKAQNLGLGIALFDAQGNELGASVEGLPGPSSEGFEPDYFHFRGAPGYVVDLADGRWVSVVRIGHHGPPRRVFFIILFIFIVVAALGCRQLARRIVRRVEALENSVTAWGDGDLEARAPTLGVDEIGRLATRFNAAADRVADLVAAHRRVVAHASHELRTPLTRLRLSLAMLAETTNEEMPGDVGADAEHTRRQGLLASSEADIEDLDALIEQLLLRSKLDAKSLARPQTEVLMGKLVTDRFERYKGDEGWSCDVAGDATVLGDPQLLAQALGNLLGNAAKYGGPHVSVRLDKDESEGRCIVTVVDDGPGVPLGERDKIFEPFYQIHGQGQGNASGVGLGLSLVRDICQWHGGEVRYEAGDGGHRGVGSRFVMVLPLVNATKR